MRGCPIRSHTGASSRLYRFLALSGVPLDPHRGTLGTDLLFSQRKCAILPVGNQNGGASLIL